MQSRWLKNFTPDPQVGEACAYGNYVRNLPCTANMLLRSVSAKRLRWRRSRSYIRKKVTYPVIFFYSSSPWAALNAEAVRIQYL